MRGGLDGVRDRGRRRGGKRPRVRGRLERRVDVGRPGVIRRQRQGGFAIRRRAEQEGQSGFTARRQLHVLAQADNRVQHVADRARERSGRDQGARFGQRVAPADEANPISFILEPCVGASAGERVHQPAGPLSGRARSPPR